MSTATMDKTVSELAPLLTKIVSEIKKKNISVSEVSNLFTQFIQEKKKTIINNSDITTLLTQIVNGMNQNNLSSSEVSNLFGQLIEKKKKTGISNAEITSFLTQITGKTKKNSLTAAEVSNLWTQYMGDTLGICVYKYFLNIVENNDLKPILEFALQLSENHITQIKKIFKQANFQVPIGFTENDVKPDAPRLFSDTFIVYYTEIMAMHGLTAYSLAITTSERKDIQNFFSECTRTGIELFQQAMQFKENLPEFSGAPYIPNPKDGVEFIKNTGILSNLLGEKRPLNVSEINNLFFNSKKTGFVRSLCLAFSQVAESEVVRKFLLKTVELSGTDAHAFDDLLQRSNLPVPRTWDGDITDSTVSPFSDKLIMFHVAFLASAALSYYGAAMGSTLRPDIIKLYNQVFNNAMQAGAMCYSIMVKNGWLEKQPEATDREALAEGAK